MSENAIRHYGKAWGQYLRAKTEITAEEKALIDAALKTVPITVLPQKATRQDTYVYAASAHSGYLKLSESSKTQRTRDYDTQLAHAVARRKLQPVRRQPVEVEELSHVEAKILELKARVAKCVDLYRMGRLSPKSLAEACLVSTHQASHTIRAAKDAGLIPEKYMLEPYEGVIQL
jgi:hypothetical protein